MGAFLNFIVRFAYIGVVIALIGLVVFARYRKYSEDTGKSVIVQKAIGVGIFVVGLIWVIFPFILKAATGNL